MRNLFLAIVCVLAFASAAYLAYAQADHQVEDKGYQDIGSYTETANKQRPTGSLYKGSGVLTYLGRPPKPYIQHDMGGYELDPAPNEDRNKAYNHHQFGPGSWEFIVTSTGMPIKMTEAGKAARAEHVTDSDIPKVHKAGNDPELMCDPLGYPRILFRNSRPFEVFHLPNVVLFHHEWHETWQKIYMDGRLLPKPPIDPAWIGYSVGKWVGDTLVVDTNGVDERAWLDTDGNPHSFGATFQTRWRRIDHNTLQMNLTINDPAMYTSTWEKESTLFELYPNLDIDILPCVPSEEFEYRNNTPTEVPDAGASTGTQSIVPPQGAVDSNVHK